MADDGMTWRMLIEDFKRGYLTAQEAREHLNEISYDLEEDLIEKIEDLIYEHEERELLASAHWTDNLPSEVVEEYGEDLMYVTGDWDEDN